MTCFGKISDHALVQALIERIREADADEIATLAPMLMVGLKYAAYDEHGDWILEFEDSSLAVFHEGQTDGLQLLSRMTDASTQG